MPDFLEEVRVDELLVVLALDLAVPLLVEIDEGEVLPHLVLDHLEVLAPPLAGLVGLGEDAVLALLETLEHLLGSVLTLARSSLRCLTSSALRILSTFFSLRL